MDKVIGRSKERALLETVMSDKQSHFIAVYGRRRIGKTFLIREVFNNRFTFQHAGLSDGVMQQQIAAFCLSLRDAGYEFKKAPKNWIEAFDGLKRLIKQSTEKRKVIFIDEISWMDTAKSDFMTALENFFNSFVSGRKDIILIVCASATSWILSKVVHSKGGLHNRLTEQINLHAFTLSECEEFVKAKGLSLNRDQILQGYMVFGGVPYYWEHLNKGLSLAQNIDNIFFAEDAPLKNEYDYLYASIFKHPDIYQKIVEALGKKKAGMTRDEIIEASNLYNSGDLSRRLEELESCGFIRKFMAFGKKSKDPVYQLMDCFTLFHLNFLENGVTDEHFWSNQINTPLVNTWKGLAFERVCLLHIKQIKQSLGISGVLTQVNSWTCKSNPDKGINGCQIDLLIARKDQVINLCEMKYSNSEYTITEKFDRDMRRKINDFQTATQTKYAIFPTLITTYGLVENSFAGNVQSVITMNDLFG